MKYANQPYYNMVFAIKVYTSAIFIGILVIKSSNISGVVTFASIIFNRNLKASFMEYV